MASKPRWFKKLNDAINAMGLPSASSEVADEMEAALVAHAAKNKAERLADRGTLLQQNPYITDSGKECDRQLFFAYSGAEVSDPPDLSAEINFEMGHVAEAAFSNILSAQGYKILDEIRVELPVGKDVIVSGRSDFILEHPSEPWLVELKSTTSEQMKWMIARQEPGKDAHRHQANLYLHASKQGLLPHVYDRAHLVYITKDASRGTRNIFAFYVDYDQAMAEADLVRLGAMWRNSKEGIDPGIPNRFIEQFYADGKKPLWPCVYCSYSTACWSGFNSARRGAA